MIFTSRNEFLQMNKPNWIANTHSVICFMWKVLLESITTTTYIRLRIKWKKKYKIKSISHLIYTRNFAEYIHQNRERKKTTSPDNIEKLHAVHKKERGFALLVFFSSFPTWMAIYTYIHTWIQQLPHKLCFTWVFVLKIWWTCVVVVFFVQFL